MSKLKNKADINFDDFIDDLPDALIEIDLTTRRVTAMNRMGLILFGYLRKDVAAGIPTTALMPPAEHERIVKRIEAFALESVSTGKPYTRTGRHELWDVTMLKKNGTAFIAETQGSFVLNENQVPFALRIFIRDVTGFRRMEESQRRRGNILSAINFATSRFLHHSSWDGYLAEVLKRIGEAAEVCRVHIFENHVGEDGNLRTSQRFEWVKEGTDSHLNHPRFQNFSFSEVGLERWATSLSQGELISGLISELPEPEQRFFTGQGIISILIVPIFVDDQWWGQIGFDECSGPRVWTESTVNALRTAADMIGATLGRYRAENELRESRERYRSILESIEEGYFEIDLAGNLIFVNDSMCRMAMAKREQLLGLNNRDYTTPETARAMYEKFNSIYRTGRTMDIVDYEIIKFNGEPAILELSVGLIRSPAGEPSGFRGVARDVTSRMQAEKLLREREEQYHDLYDNAPDMYFSVRPDGRIMSVNQFGAEYLGYTKEDLFDQPVWLVVHPDDLEAVRAQVGQIVADLNEKTELEFRKIRKDGTVLYVHERCQLIVDEDRRPVELRIICRDITDRRRAEQEREAALEKARRADKVKNLFLANMSHEIRTPLNSLLGFTAIVEERFQAHAGEEEKNFFDIIHRSGKRLLRTVHEILDISQIEAGTFQVKLENINLSQLVQNATSEVSADLVDKDVILDYQTPANDVYLISNEYCLYQSLLNVLDNAIKYTEKGFIKIEVGRTDNRITLTVEDSGIGITADYLDKLFQTFSQESEGYNKDYQGIGLGLALTKRYLDMISATIRINSRKNEGTCVIMSFPTVIERAGLPV
ncbi:MAG: PAS domain S-box protein [Candidatus Neomarinimicrobiota bacterium]